MGFRLQMLQGLPGKSGENASPVFCNLLPPVNLCFSVWQKREKTTTEKQKRQYRYSAGERGGSGVPFSVLQINTEEFR